ncbi:hypothetical protein GQ53DRAFT_834067 [Thozetella sp. PMI_491]|nr:hypothetical protein GQ53DRAFT_834067 [Thozetella sp. PMI_491]
MLASSFKQGLALISCAWLACGLDVSLDFYTSIDCKTASTITPSAALNLSICVVTPGLVSLHYDTVPCAGGGIVVPYLFGDTTCGSQQGILDFYKTGSDFRCLSDFTSDTIAAVMLSCNQNHPEQPQGTSTISVAHVATDAPPTSTTSASSGLGSNLDEGQNTQKGWNSLSLGARIGIIVAAAVVAFILSALCFCLRRRPSPPPTWTPPYTSPYTSPRDSAYLHVLGNVVETARQHAASGYFDNGHVHSNDIVNPGNALSPQVLSAAFAEHDQEWKHRLGAAGELYIFEYLRSIRLPNFGLQNWTSSLRTICKVYPEYHDIGPSRDGIADLEYFDENGVFTEFLLAHGYSGRGIQRGMRPTYRFEVKATTSTNWRAPFYMSRNQEAHKCFDISEPDCPCVHYL